MEATERVDHTSTNQQPLSDFQKHAHDEQSAPIVDQWHDTEPFQAYQDHDHDWTDEVDSAIDSTESIAFVTSLRFIIQSLMA